MKESSNLLEQMAEVMLQGDAFFCREASDVEAIARTSSCSKPQIAELIALLGYKFLIRTLDLEDKLFAAVYKNTALNLGNRQELKRLITSHYRTCEHCRAVAKKEKELERKVNSFLVQERKTIRTILLKDQKKGLRRVR